MRVGALQMSENGVAIDRVAMRFSMRQHRVGDFILAVPGELGATPRALLLVLHDRESTVGSSTGRTRRCVA